MKKRLLMIAACTVALSTQAEATSHRLNTFIGSGIAAIGAAGMIYSGVQWGTTANNLENGALSHVEREALLEAKGNYKSAFAASSILTAAGATVATISGYSWYKEERDHKEFVKMAGGELSEDELTALDADFVAFDAAEKMAIEAAGDDEDAKDEALKALREQRERHFKGLNANRKITSDLCDALVKYHSDEKLTAWEKLMILDDYRERILDLATKVKATPPADDE